MQTSRIIEIDGVFVGAALMLPNAEGWRFVAADDRALAANGTIAGSFAEAQSVARRAFFTARSAAPLVGGQSGIPLLS